ncbi:MAG: glycosyltransferase family 4 protein [Candidatus Edwardsbacteria bacterium]|nr:glycosyltransferase family 4 protein [Candidatus Edwardsbacteria bacterium]MBU1576552.1 glycosyltransferase family 4 protein [Candidatus Edwardsbacteria bacterium]MBU2462766.1 glycosyltransferase family 4 protein [Candidatus Edwardsbacteria bacterium]MBU2594773.1 glycosyltransferase family 4 protein [Candidatus Edwardsbacteria bacterium]
MKVDIINDQPEHSGAGVYAWNLYRALKDQAGIRFVYYNYQAGSCDFYGKNGMDSRLSVAKSIAKPLFWKNCSRAYEHCENIHILSQNLSFLKPGKRRIITCLDLIPLIMPGSLLEKYWRRILYSGIKKADHIISISQATKDDLVRFYRISPDKITPIMLGVSPEYHLRDKTECRQKLGLSISDKIILHVGTPAPRKNFITVLMAFNQITKSRQDVLLLKVGRISNAEQAYISSNDLSGRVLVRDNIPGDDLPLYYAASDILAFPSLYEGFGLPVLEAMASGCPVITSNTTSLPEVAGDAGIMIDPTNQESLKNKILEILENIRLSDELTQKGLLRAKIFTWENTAENTLAVYKKVFE